MLQVVGTIRFDTPHDAHGVFSEFPFSLDLSYSAVLDRDTNGRLTVSKPVAVPPLYNRQDTAVLLFRAY